MAFVLQPAAPFEGEAILSIEDAKAFLRVDGLDEDATIGALRDAAIDWVERYTARGLSRRAWIWRGECFDAALRLSFGPVASVTAISYRDTGGATVALTGTDWRFAGDVVAATAPGGWPLTGDGAGAVTVAFTAGYEDASREAPALLSAVRMLLGHFFTNRSAVVTGTIATTIPFAVEAICRPYRTPVIG